MPDSNKLRFKYLSHRSLHEGPPKVFQDPGLPLIEARDSCFSSKIWAKFRTESIRGKLHEILGWDYRVPAGLKIPLGTLLHDTCREK